MKSRRVRKGQRGREKEKEERVRENGSEGESLFHGWTLG
jgi:hypothetical protein